MNFFKKFNKLDFGDKAKKKKIISLAVTILGILLIVTGTSAAYLMSQKEGTKNTITAGTLVLSLPTESEGITLNGALPISDEAGVSGSNSYTFTLKNSGTLKMNYAIYLKNKCSTTSSVTIGSETITPDICIPNEYIKVGLKKGTEDYQIITLDNDELLMKGTMDSNETIDFSLKIWLDENTPNEYNAILDGVERNIIYYGKLELTGEQYINLDKSGANLPELATGMIPVYYDETAETWKKADSNNIDKTNKWYDYDSKMWANAVTVSETNRNAYVKADVGTPISMDDINTMWVWIPRFSATGDTANYNGGTQSAPGAFDITFVDNKTNAHDAFTFGTQDLNGFWSGKFETSHETLSSSTTANNLGCTNDTCSNANGIIIKPNVVSLRYNDISNFYYANLSMKQSSNSFGFDTGIDTTLDTHMMKNNEWGAVAYLTQSIYGRCTSSTSCTEVGINNNGSYITGYGAPAGSSNSVTNGTYETILGKDASTTGNIYGIYDMSGGAYEYVMGVYTDGTQNWSGYDSSSNSGFTGCLGSSCSSTYNGLAYPNSKYYNSYTTSTNYTTANLQHALIETKNWFGDSANFVIGNNPWFKRGGYYYDGSDAGVFYYFLNNGISYSYNGSRSSLIIN